MGLQEAMEAFREWVRVLLSFWSLLNPNWPIPSLIQWVTQDVSFCCSIDRSSSSTKHKPVMAPRVSPRPPGMYISRPERTPTPCEEPPAFPSDHAYEWFNRFVFFRWEFPRACVKDAVLYAIPLIFQHTNRLCVAVLLSCSGWFLCRVWKGDIMRRVHELTRGVYVVYDNLDLIRNNRDESR